MVSKVYCVNSGPGWNLGNHGNYGNHGNHGKSS